VWPRPTEFQIKGKQVKYIFSIIVAILLATSAHATTRNNGNNQGQGQDQEQLQGQLQGQSVSIVGDEAASYAPNVNGCDGIGVSFGTFGATGGFCLPGTPRYRKLMNEAMALERAYGPVNGPVVALRHLCMNSGQRIQRTLGGCPAMP
jgi:hypothetical protein